MIDEKYMRLAIGVARESVEEEGRELPTPKVGAVLARDGTVLATNARGKTGPGDHAEFGLLAKILKDTSTAQGADLYVTLEPCTLRGPDKTPCAQRIVDAGIRRVVIGIPDPNRDIQGDGYWLLSENGIDVAMFPPELAAQIKSDNANFIKAHRPNRWTPPPALRSLDDWYFITNAIYLDRNFGRAPTWILAHLVEIIGGLSYLATDKTKPDVNVQDFLPKAIVWWFALCGAVGIRSVEDMLWLKFPSVCTYCHENPHNNKRCKEQKKASRHPDWDGLRAIAKQNSALRPRLPDEWKRMFGQIYQVAQTESYDVTFGRLCEELGELSECVRVIDVLPSSFLSEAADVFAWLMHLANLVEEKSDTALPLGSLLYEKYPDRCRECNGVVCSCPPFLPKTLRRIAHEGPRYIRESGETAFFSPEERLSHFNIGASELRILNDVHQVSAAVLQELYGWAGTALNAVRTRSSSRESATFWDKLISCLSSIRSLAAIQRGSQHHIDRMILLVRSASRNDAREASRLLKPDGDGPVAHSLAHVLEHEVARAHE